MSISSAGALWRGFLEVARGAGDYFKPYTYDVPLVMRQETHEGLRRAHAIFLKCLRHFVEQYARYRDQMPVPAKVLEILALYDSRPFHPGSYRTDFLVDGQSRIRLIETNGRFALSGYFISGFAHRLADRYMASVPGIQKVDAYTPFFNRLLEYFGAFDHVCVLQGAEKRTEARYIVPIFEAAGFPAQCIPAEALPQEVQVLEGAAVMSMLSQEELCALPLQTISALVRSKLLNDLRTVFLAGDKRFFALLHHGDLLPQALSADEISELQPYLVPTFTRQMNPEIWPQAREEKDRWVAKPFAQGLSIGVVAGPVTEEAAWRFLFDSGQADDMVLQEFVPQRKFKGRIGEHLYEDYATGTLLFFEEDYFGPGIFRASSFMVTNRRDDRKIAPLVTSNVLSFDQDNII